MRFLYHEGSSCEILNLEGEGFVHVVKSRRAKVGEILTLRNLKDGCEYGYEIEQIGKKSATLKLVEKTELQSSICTLVVGWCMVDVKSVEKVLPMLNELGVKKIVFVTSAFSLGNFTIDSESL